MTLLANGHPGINLKYASKLPERIRRAMKEEKVPWGPVGYVTYKRTYSRHIDEMDDSSPKEEYWQTQSRCLQGLLDINGAFTLRELECFAGYLMQLKTNFSGRGLWQLGTSNVAKLGGDSLQACWHVRVDEPIHPFTFLFEELMLGGGVGFSIMPEDVYSLPVVKNHVRATRIESFDCDLIITDNREGWVGFLRKILEAAFYGGKTVFTYNTRCIRNKGERIRSFGGTASGPEDLVLGMNEILRILNNAVGRKLTPLECLDIQNILGMIVVAGNVRRSAQIAKGSGRDRDFLLAKYWGDGAIIPKWRQSSNNTVDETNLRNLLPEFWWGYDNVDEHGHAQGECYGLFNTYLASNYGRLADPIKPGYNGRVCGPNPCGEILLESNEACNLGELYLTNLLDSTEFHTGATLMYKALKTISTLPFISERTNEVVSRNHRLGLGVTGVAAAHHLRKGYIFDGVYEHIVEEDKEYSQTLNTTTSIAYTTVKPSGTSAKLPIGCTPGANNAFALTQLLRITFASDSPMLPTLRKKGYPMEPKINLDGSRDYNSTMVSFPVRYPEGTPCDGEVSAIKQLENVVFLQRHWSDNAVSATIQFRPEEVPAIKDWLFKNYETCLKTISFTRHTGHGFQQAPNEVLSLTEYTAFVNSVEPIDSFDNDNDDSAIEGIECVGDRCGVK